MCVCVCVHICLCRSTIVALTAWWRLFLIGLLVTGLFPMVLPMVLTPIIGKEESVVLAIGSFSLWFVYIVWYAIKHVLSSSTAEGKGGADKRLNVTIVTGFLVSRKHSNPSFPLPGARFQQCLVGAKKVKRMNPAPISATCKREIE